jgi:predicted negative regulator of RcsB-dependent stress response
VVTDSAPADRIRTLLLRGDNLLKNGRSADKAREAFEEARGIAQDPSVDERVRELIERRLATLDDR